MNYKNKLTNVLYIDLTKKRFFIKNRTELFNEYIGGTGVATQILHEECPQGIDPYDPANPVILAIGPLTGLFPLASKTVAMFKSPLTGNLGESHAGGRSAVAIRSAGFGAVVIKGKSDVPIYISIREGKVFFNDATTLWGMSSCFTVGSVVRQNEKGAGFRSIMRIGKAGENLVSYAAVTTETFRHFGRLGLGAVLGSKKLKAIVISGKDTIPIENKKAYRNIYDEIYKSAVESPLMKKYHDLGTAGNVTSLNKLGGLPTKNLKTGKFDKAETISGEYIAENYLGRRLACSHCPVGCIHIAAIREAYKNEEYFYKTTMVGYDFELIYALGSSLGISNPEEMLRLIDLVEKLCIDVMSTGVALAWATEAMEKGVISVKDTGGIELKWGDYKAYSEAVQAIVDQPNEFFSVLAKGTYSASQKYGGKEYSLNFGKNEMAGYHTGPGCYLGYILGTRHSHLDNAGYSIDQKMILNGNVETPSSIVDKLMDEEQWRQILSGLTICFFARGVYSKDVVIKALDAAGMGKTEKELDEIGRKIYAQKYKFKFREGFSFDEVHLPERIFETKSPSINFDREFIMKAVAYAEKQIQEIIKKVK